MISKDQAVTIAKTKLDEDVKRFQQIIDPELEKYQLDSIITIKIPNGMSVHVVNTIIDLYSEFQWTVERTSVTEGDQRETYQVPALKFW
jgi:hypothetical protein